MREVRITYSISELISIISGADEPTGQYDKGSKYLLKFLDEYNLQGTIEASAEQLQEFIKKYNIKGGKRCK